MYVYLIISILSGLLVGYNYGFQKGKKEGINLGLKRAPLIFLEKSLERGYCFICGKTSKLD